MYLQEIYDQLTHGELSQVYVGGAVERDDDDDETGIRDEDQPRILDCIELGLNALYKRFNLKEGHVKCNMVNNQSIYIIDRHFLISNTTGAANGGYLDDSDYPFSDRPLKIDAISDDKDVPLPLNDRLAHVSVRTSSANTLVIPEALRLRKLMKHHCDVPMEFINVVYRANHPKIDKIMAAAAPQVYEIELPEPYLEALLYFVASRIMNPVGMSGEFHSGNNWASKYEYACQRLENENLDIDEGNYDCNFEQSGYV